MHSPPVRVPHLAGTRGPCSMQRISVSVLGCQDTLVYEDMMRAN